MKLIVISGNRGTLLGEEFSNASHFSAVRSFENIESYISRVYYERNTNATNQTESTLIVVGDHGFSSNDYEPCITVLSGIIKKHTVSTEVLLVTNNKKLYFCWKTFAEKNSGLNQFFISDPFITNWHITQIVTSYLRNKATVLPEVLNRPSMNTYHTSANKVAESYAEFEKLADDKAICLTGSDWALVKEVEKLVNEKTSPLRKIDILTIKSKDIIRNLDKWERIYLVNGDNPSKAMENQNLLLFLESSVSMKVLNKKIRIIETAKDSSMIHINSAKDFLTRV